ncbi:MAG: hypothetical protein U9Q03_00485 [Patescibacteria group bacterium]|nr:hypothetical protein [Patescibacteria group bacterium]
MANVMRKVPWSKFVRFGWLVGATIRTREKILSQVAETEGVIIDVDIGDGQVMFKVRGIDPPRTYEVDGETRNMDVTEYDDGSYRFHIPYVGPVRISLD